MALRSQPQETDWDRSASRRQERWGLVLSCVGFGWRARSIRVYRKPAVMVWYHPWHDGCWGRRFGTSGLEHRPNYLGLMVSPPQTWRFSGRNSLILPAHDNNGRKRIGIVMRRQFSLAIVRRPLLHLTISPNKHVRPRITVLAGFDLSNNNGGRNSLLGGYRMRRRVPQPVGRGTSNMPRTYAVSCCPRPI